jgi:hypothetical protein
MVDYGDGRYTYRDLDNSALPSGASQRLFGCFFETMADDSSSRDHGDGLYTYRDLDNPALSSGVSQWLSDCFLRLE